jgi:fatty acid desaturase
MKKFKGLSGVTLWIAGMIVASYVLQILTAMGLGYWLLQQPSTLLTGLGLALVMFFIGTRFRGINNIVHECSHFTFTLRREDNVLFGRICASLLLGSFRAYRDEHMSHHAHCGDYEKDLDLQGSRAFRFEDPLTPKTILRHALTPVFGLHLRRLPNVNFSARDGELYRAFKIGLIAAAIVFLVLDPLAALLLVWVPFIWVYNAINYWTECIDHAGLVGSDDDLESSRNLIVPKTLRMILFPRNDCYHLIHHLFPQVPAHHYGACHQQLLTDPDYRARTEGRRAQGSVGNRKTTQVANKLAKWKGSAPQPYRARSLQQPSK